MRRADTFNSAAVFRPTLLQDRLTPLTSNRSAESITVLRWTGKAYWGYYGYHEEASDVVQDAFAPRNFRANLVTLSLRYAF
jgi:hypothetical protein